MFLNLFLFYQVVRPLGRKSVDKYLYLYRMVPAPIAEYTEWCSFDVVGERVEAALR